MAAFRDEFLAKVNSYWRSWILCLCPRKTTKNASRVGLSSKSNSNCRTPSSKTFPCSSKHHYNPLNHLWLNSLPRKDLLHVVWEKPKCILSCAVCMYLIVYCIPIGTVIIFLRIQYKLSYRPNLLTQHRRFSFKLQHKKVVSLMRQRNRKHYRDSEMNMKVWYALWRL